MRLKTFAHTLLEEYPILETRSALDLRICFLSFSKAYVTGCLRIQSMFNAQSGMYPYPLGTFVFSTPFLPWLPQVESQWFISLYHHPANTSRDHKCNGDQLIHPIPYLQRAVVRGLPVLSV